MFSMEMYPFFIMILAARGSPQTCLYYCKQLTDNLQKVPQECNCTTFYLSEVSPNKNIEARTMKRETSTLAEHNLNHLHKTGESYLHGTTQTVEYPLFLDFNLHTSSSKPGIDKKFKEYFKHVFEKIRASEKHVNECTDLHIYIFSKNNDNIKITHTNWGHVTHDKLTDSDVMTEILNKCDHPVTIVHESVYEIKKRKYLKSTIVNNSLDEKKYKNVLDNLSLTPSTKGLKINQRKFGNKNVQETTTAFTTVTDNGKIFMNGNENQSDEDSISKRLETYATTKMPTYHNGFRRDKHMEKDLLIPKIITREYANNTITSVVDGFELIPNQDFVQNHVFSKTRKSLESVDDHADNTDQTNLIQNTTGNLHISMDNNPIPARFILNSKGEMQLAFNGFALCNQMTENQKEKIVFMKLICQCIQFLNCSS